MTQKQGKVWGSTTEIFSNPFVGFHRIDFNSDYKCSHHKHEFRWNLFYVVSGKMMVKVEQKDYQLEDKTILEAGEWTTVRPGLVHTFVGVEAGVAFELYYPEPVKNSDIIREDVGGPLTKN